RKNSVFERNAPKSTLLANYGSLESAAYRWCRTIISGLFPETGAFPQPASGLVPRHVLVGPLIYPHSCIAFPCTIANRNPALPRLILCWLPSCGGASAISWSLHTGWRYNLASIDTRDRPTTEKVPHPKCGARPGEVNAASTGLSLAGAARPTARTFPA